MEENSIAAEILNGVAPPTNGEAHTEPETEPSMFFTLDDVGNGTRFAHRYNGEVMHDHSQRRWMIYDGMRYKEDETKHCFELAESLSRQMMENAAEAGDEAFTKWSAKTRGRERINAMLAGASSKPNIAVVNDQLDSNPYLFNVSNGTLDLEGDIRFRDHARGDRITRLAPIEYNANALCPLWLSVLERIMPDADVRTWLQTRLGYTLTGDTRLQEMYIPYGLGRNGKTTIFQTLRKLFGEYAITVQPATFQVKREDGGPRADLVKLAGVRLVLAPEGKEGLQLDEGLIKLATGGENIVARTPHAPKEIEYTPQFKPFYIANHQPEVSGIDLGIQRRLKVVPFTVTIPQEEADETIPEQLLTELPGILNWLLEGLYLLRTGRVTEPEAVRVAVEEYFASADTVGAFLEECTVEAADGRTTTTAMVDRYNTWATKNHEMPLGPKQLAKRLKDRGMKQMKSGPIRYWYGLKLYDAKEEEDRKNLYWNKEDDKPF